MDSRNHIIEVFFLFSFHYWIFPLIVCAQMFVRAIELAATELSKTLDTDKFTTPRTTNNYKGGDVTPIQVPQMWLSSVASSSSSLSSSSTPLPSVPRLDSRSSKDAAPRIKSGILVLQPQLRHRPCCSNFDIIIIISSFLFLPSSSAQSSIKRGSAKMGSCTQTGRGCSCLWASWQEKPNGDHAGESSCENRLIV